MADQRLRAPYRAPGERSEAPPVVSPPRSVGAELRAFEPRWLILDLIRPATVSVIAFLFVGAIADASPVAGAVAALLVAASFWPALRGRGRVAEHEQGISFSRGGKRVEVAFDDVNEVWLEGNALASYSERFLRALRLVTYAGQSVRIPLAYAGGLSLATNVLRACSQPLYAEARQALRAGESLVFGRVTLDARGVGVGSSFTPWSELHSARVQNGRIRFKRHRFWAWRTVSISSVPHASVLAGLVAANVARFEYDMPWLLPSAAAAAGTELRVEKKSLHFPVVALVGGIAVAGKMYASHQRVSVTALLFIAYGVYAFLRDRPAAS